MTDIHKRMTTAAAMALLLLLASCATGPDFKRVESFPYGQALVYFYRPSMYTASGQNYTIKLVETELGKLKSGTYFTYLARPGPHTFYYEGIHGYAKLSVELVAGETYYIRGQPTGFLGSSFKLEQMHPMIGQVEIMECSLSK